MGLHNLKPAKGSVRNRKRVGRGPGSGLGKTAGRGEKGQKSRSGFARKPGFEGGQMPLHRRLPKRGFTNIFRKEYAEVSLDRVAQAIEAGRLDAGQTIDAEALKAAGVIRRVKKGVRILGGQVGGALTFDVAGASRPAIAAIEGAGGSIKVAQAAEATEASS